MLFLFVQSISWQGSRYGLLHDVQYKNIARFFLIIIKSSLHFDFAVSGNAGYGLLYKPTIGLHFDDIALLLEVIGHLKGKGNSIVIIEHNLDVIKTADYIVDLGLEGGDGTGRIIARGSPEQVTKVKGSYTGKYLNKML